MNFKRCKPSKKKSNSWGTPRFIQRLKEGRPTYPPGKKKYPCKRLKGDHIFRTIKEQQAKWFRDIFIEKRCKGCNKKKIEYLSQKIS